MALHNRIAILVLFICFFGFPECGKADKSVSAIEEIKEAIESLVMGDKRDVYKPIREGRVTLDSLPNGSELLTWRKYYARRHDWHVETYLQNYKRHGHRSASWDHRVRKVLADYAVFRREWTGAAYRQGLLDQVEDIIALGCRDARLISIQGILTYTLKNTVDAAPFLKQGLELLERSDYPRRYLFYAASHLDLVYANSRGGDNARQEYHRLKMTYLGQAAEDADFGNGHQRYYMQEFMAAFENQDCRAPANVDLLMAPFSGSPKVDPWIALVARGIYHHARAWEFRGSGFASSVTKEGWKRFKAEMAKARQHLVQAHEMHPAYPEAAAHMIRVAMAIPGDVGFRQWFQRTVDAHFDYGFAHENLLWALRPRWRGSHKEMLKLGIECLNTQRFDTRVPSKFLVSLYQIGDDLDNWRIPYQWPGIYDLIREYFDGLLNEPLNRDYYYDNKSFYAVVAWAAGQYQDAHRLMQELGPRFDRRAYGYLNVTRDQVLNDIRGALEK